ncbi:tetratricopeptide repeat-containing sensor histidine kinase [Flavisolibacter tropicus]|nr:tetratricopeptide repeat protein [Flavisolibacter tropicus]
MRIQIRKTALLLFLFYFIGQGLNAQVKEPEQAQVDSLNTLFVKVEEKDLYKAEALANDALKIAEEADYTKGIADAKSNLGTVSVRQGNFKQAIDHYFFALKLYDQLGILPKAKDYVAVIVRLAGAFCLEEDFDRALTYSQKAILLSEKNNYHELSGIAYRVKGETFRGLGKLDSSSYYFESALAAFSKSKNLTHMGSVYTDIGINYYYVKDYKQAFLYTQKAFELIQQTNNKPEYAVLLHNMGEFSYLMKSYQQALFYLDSAQYYGEYFHASGNLMDTYKVKAEVYKALGITDSVAHYYEKTLQVKDSLYNDTYKKELATLQTQSDVYKKETENKLLSKDKRIAELYRNLAIAGIIGLIIVLGFLLLTQRLRIHRRVKDKLEEEVVLRTKEIFRQKETIFHTNLRLKLALNGAKFDSQFVHNALSTIQQLVLEQKTQEAQNHLVQLSQLIQYVLEKSPLERVPLKEELQMVESYIQLERLRLNNCFDYSITSHAAEQTKIPALLLQPFVENAISTAIASTADGQQQLLLQIEASNDTLNVVIIDSGKNRKKERRNKYNPLGNQLGQERLDLLTHLTHKNHLAIVEDLESENGSNGTKVTLQIPLSGQPISSVEEFVNENS